MKAHLAHLRAIPLVAPLLLATVLGLAPPVQAWLVVVGLVVLYLLTHLPWIGGLATVVALCVGLGALVRQFASARGPGPAPATPGA